VLTWGNVAFPSAMTKLRLPYSGIFQRLCLGGQASRFNISHMTMTTYAVTHTCTSTQFNSGHQIRTYLV
jgi:hypothetical protein